MQDVPVVKRQRHGINQVTISASVPGEVAQKVRLLARRRNVTLASVVTEALQMYFTVVPVAISDDERAA